DRHVARLELRQPMAPVVDGDHDGVVSPAAEEDGERLGALERHGREAVLLETVDVVLGLVREELELHLLELFLVVDQGHPAARRRHGDAPGELVRAAHRKIPPACCPPAWTEPPLHRSPFAIASPPLAVPPSAPAPASPRKASGSVSSSAVVAPPSSFRNSTDAIRSSRSMPSQGET